jgi:hypothetical protein
VRIPTVEPNGGAAVWMRALRNPRRADGGTIAPAARRIAGLRARYTLLAVATCVGVLALGAASAEAMVVRTGSSSVRSASSDPAPTIDSQSTSNVGAQIATLDAQINPQGTDTTCEFQYVDDTDFMSSGFTGPNVVTVPCDPQNLGSATSDVSALANITGLEPNTLYDFQAVATPTGGTAVDGGAAQFSTGPDVSIDSESASAITPQGATLNAQINPEGNDTTCEFQYVDDTDFMSTGFTGPNVVTTACSPSDLGTATNDQSASLTVTGLAPNTLYDFRAVATNSLTGPSGFNGPDAQFTTLPAVSVDSQSVSNVTDTSATLHAQLNPNGLDTTYQFIVTGPGLNEQVPSQAVDIGSGTTDVGAEAVLTGLTPGTTYTYQAKGTNSAGTSLGNPQTFTTFPTANTQPTGLPDNRGYEMVTPVNKDNGEPYLRAGELLGPITSPTSGNALSWFSLSALPGSVFDGAFYVSTRGSDSWTTTAVIPPQGTETSLLCATIAPEAVGYSQDMSETVLADGGNAPFCSPDNPPLVPGEPRGAQDLFVIGGGGSPLLVDPAPVAGGTPSNATFDGASADLSTVVFDESAQLTSDAPGTAASPVDDLYASSPAPNPNPTVKLVTYLPGNVPVTGALAGAGASTSAGSEGDAFGAISADGSKIFFTATPTGSSTTNLYVRENPLSSSASTVQLDSSIGGGGNFLAATADGSEVFFTDSSGSNLYEYNFNASGNPVTNLTPNGSAGIDGLAGIDPTGSDLYFVANSVLASNQNSFGQSATNGQPNLYLIRNGDPTTTAFIATLNGGDSNDWSPSSLASRVSSNGSFIAFTTTNALNTSTPTTTVPPQIYVYDAGTNALNCGSCAPGGPPASAGASIRTPFTPVDFANGEFLQRYVSDSGQLFFDTPDALLPAVQNNGVSDVYEWEADGTGTCTSSADNGGCLYLLSGGTSSFPSFFADASPDGNNVFFVTDNALVPQDTDLGADFYDARVNGGFPATAPPPSCQGDSCKPPETPTPPVPVIATVNFSGPGNVTGSTSSSSRITKHAVIAVHSQRLAGDRVKIRVTVPAAGRLSAAGAGVKGSARYVRHAGTYTLIVQLKPRAMAALVTKHKLKFTITVRYVPAAGRASAAVISLTVKG